MANASNGNAYIPGGTGGGGVAIAAGGATNSSGTVVFANSNGITFGNNNGTITATVTPGAAAGIAAIQVSNTTYTSGTAVFSNANGFSFGSSAGGGITGSYTVPGATVFSNSNNVSFGLNGSTITATATANPGVSAISAGTTSVAGGAVVFSNSNGLAFGLNGSTVTGSYTVPGATVFSNSNNVSFGLNGSTITATVTTPAQTAQTQSNIQAIQAGTTSANTGAVSFSNANGVSFGLNGQTVTASINSTSAAGLGTTFAGTNISASITLNTAGLNLALSGGAGAGGAAISAAGSSQNAGTIVFSNSNGVSFGMNGSTITASASGAGASATVLAQSQTTGQSSSGTLALSAFNVAGYGIVSVGWSASTLQISGPGTTNFANLSLSAGTTSNSLGSLVLSNSNGVSFGLNGSTITASVNATGAPNFSAGTTSNNLGTLVFSNSNGVSFGLNGSTITASAAAGGGAAISAAGSSQNAGTIVFSNSNGVSFGMNGSTITATVTPGAAAGVAAAAAGTQTQTSGTLVFVNSNSITFGMSNSSQITASFSTAAQTNQTLGLYALGNTTQNSSSTFDARTMSFNALGAMTMGYSNGSIQVSAPATSSISGTGGISLSTNGSTISIGYAGTTESGFNPYADLPMLLSQVGQGSLIIDPNAVPAFQYDRVLIPIYNSNSALSSGSHSLTFAVGLYTRNASTLSLLGSTSASTAVTHSGQVGSYSLFSGMRHFSIGSTRTMTAGRYWMAFLSSTSSAGADGSYSNVVEQVWSSNTASLNFNGFFGVAQNNSQQFTLGQGIYSAATSVMPASIAFSQISGVTNTAQNMQMLMFASSTV